MFHFKNLIGQFLAFCFISFLFLFVNLYRVSAEQINWVEVATTQSGIQSIDINSIKYNNDFLYVLTKYSELAPDDQRTITTDSYLMAIDCEKRLFRRLPVNGAIKKIKNWDTPINDKLIKKTIISSCSY